MVPNTNTTELGDLYANTLNADVLQGNNGFTAKITQISGSTATLSMAHPYVNTGSGATSKAALENFNLRNLQFTYYHSTATDSNWELGMNYETDSPVTISSIDTNKKILTFASLPQMKNRNGTLTNIPVGSRIIAKADELILNGKVRIVGDQHSSLSEQSQLTINGVMQVGDGDETDAFNVNAGKVKFELHDNGSLTGSSNQGAGENNGEFYCDADGLITLKSTLADPEAIAFTATG